MIDEKRFSRLEMRESLEKLNKEIAAIRETWCSNYTVKDSAKILDSLDRWKQKFTMLNLTGAIETKVLARTAHFALMDLNAKVRTPHKVHATDSLLTQVSLYTDFIDPDGVAFASIDLCDRLLHALYKEIKFKQ